MPQLPVLESFGGQEPTVWSLQGSLNHKMTVRMFKPNACPLTWVWHFRVPLGKAMSSENTGSSYCSCEAQLSHYTRVPKEDHVLDPVRQNSQGSHPLVSLLCLSVSLEPWCLIDSGL